MFRLGDIITIMKTVTLGGGNASTEPNTQPNAWVHLYTNPGSNSIAIEAYEMMRYKVRGIRTSVAEHLCQI